MEKQPHTNPEARVSRREPGYTGFIAHSLEKARSAETAGAIDWYKERVPRLPEMETRKTALTGAGGWSKEMTLSNEVLGVSGMHFDIEGRQVVITKPDGSTGGWVQPGLMQKELPISLPSPDGEVQLDTSGLVGLLTDPEGNVLLTVGQEPLAQTDKKALVRTPFQTSAAKLTALLAGDREKDPNLADVLDKVGQGRPISELFASGAVETFPLSPADPNRISATNLGFTLKVEDADTRKALEADGANRWCTPAEVKALIRAGVVNGHTAAVHAAA